MKKFKFLGLLSVFSLLFTCFSSANTEYDWIVFVPKWNNRTIPGWTTFDYGLVNSSSCFTVNYNWQYLEFYKSDWTFIATWVNTFNLLYCPTTEWYIKNTSTSNLTLNFYDLSFKNSSQSCPECPICSPQYTSEQCQSVYGLVSSGDLSSCQSSLSSCQLSLSGWNNTLSHCSNSLNTCQSNLENCIQANCPSIDVNTWYSTLYINDIRHQSMPFIYVNIPEEFSWDYSTWINDFTIDISWYNVDTDYIAWIIDTQNYKPDESDFNKIITDVIPLFVPWLVIILFLYFIFRFIKKIF